MFSLVCSERTISNADSFQAQEGQTEGGQEGEEAPEAVEDRQKDPAAARRQPGGAAARPLRENKVQKENVSPKSNVEKLVNYQGSSLSIIPLTN